MDQIEEVENLIEDFKIQVNTVNFSERYDDEDYTIGTLCNDVTSKEQLYDFWKSFIMFCKTDWRDNNLTAQNLQSMKIYSHKVMNKDPGKTFKTAQAEEDETKSYLLYEFEFLNTLWEKKLRK